MSQFIHESILGREYIQLYYENIYNYTMRTYTTILERETFHHICKNTITNVIHCIGACLKCHGPSCSQNSLGGRALSLRIDLYWIDNPTPCC